jgi:hypothetical protein
MWGTRRLVAGIERVCEYPKKEPQVPPLRFGRDDNSIAAPAAFETWATHSKSGGCSFIFRTKRLARTIHGR